MPRRGQLWFVLWLFLHLTMPLSAENWPEFRGPRGDGSTTSTKLPLEFSETKHVRWKTPLAGKAWSSPVVWGRQIWLSNATEDGKQLSAVCLDGDSGKMLHDLLLFDIAEPQFCHPFNSFGSPTPAIEENFVYIHFGSAGTACVDTRTAKVVWARQDLPCDHFRGPGSSPVIWNDLLLLTLDGFDYQYVTALDKRTGKTVWKTDRNIDYGDVGNADGDYKKAYSTPAVFDINGTPTMISPSAICTIAYDVRDGKELWRAQTGGYNSGCRVILHQGLAIGHTESGMKLFAIKPDGRGDVTNTHVVWTHAKGTPTRPSPVVKGDLLFTLANDGVVSCLLAKTGELKWQKRLEGDYSASPLIAGDRIYCFSQDGDCPVFAAKDEFELLAENQLDEGFMASPAVLDDALILRTRTHVYRIESQE